MRPASSFLLSLLMFASIIGVQLIAMLPAGSQDVVAMAHVLDAQPHEYGVDVLQGFYYARPMPVEAFPAWLASREATE